MRRLVFSRRGEMLAELDEVGQGAVEWGMAEGLTSVSVPKESDDYALKPRFWTPEAIGNRLLVLLMPDRDPHPGAGLPDWCGVFGTPEDDGDTIRIGVVGAQACLKRLVMARPLTMAGDLRTVLIAARGLCRRDGYPVEFRVEPGGRDLKGVKAPQSLLALVSGLCEELGWEWTVVPRVYENRLVIEVIVKRRLGREYGDDAALWAGQDLLRDGLSQSGDALRRVNHIVAFGKGERLETAPRVEVPATDDDDIRRNGALSMALQFPEISDLGRLRTAANGALARLRRIDRRVMLPVTAAEGGAKTYRLLRLGNTWTPRVAGFDRLPVRLIGFGWNPDTDTAVTTVRHRYEAGEIEGATELE